MKQKVDLINEVIAAIPTMTSSQVNLLLKLFGLEKENREYDGVWMLWDEDTTTTKLAK